MSPERPRLDGQDETLRLYGEFLASWIAAGNMATRPYDLCLDSFRAGVAVGIQSRYVLVPNGALKDTLADLPPAQRLVAELMAQGRSNKEIAYKLKRSEKTVRNHTSALYERFGVHSRGELMLALWGREK